MYQESELKLPKEEMLSRLLFLRDKIKTKKELGVKNGVLNGRDFFFDFTFLLCEYGEVLTSLKNYYDRVGWPKYYNNRYYSKYDIWSIDDESLVCTNAINEMFEQIELDYPSFLKDTDVYSLYSKLYMKGSTGSYDIPRDPNICELKKILLSKVVATCFEIWNGKRLDIYLGYNNPSEWNYFVTAYSVYEYDSNLHHRTNNRSGELEMTQFGDEVKMLFSYIQNNFMSHEIEKKLMLSKND